MTSTAEKTLHHCSECLKSYDATAGIGTGGALGNEAPKVLM